VFGPGIGESRAVVRGAEGDARRRSRMRPSTAQREHLVLHDYSTPVAASSSVGLPVRKRLVLRLLFYRNSLPLVEPQHRRSCGRDRGWRCCTYLLLLGRVNPKREPKRVTSSRFSPQLWHLFSAKGSVLQPDLERLLPYLHYKEIGKPVQTIAYGAFQQEKCEVK
jgi:hypothetical protein